MEVQKSLSSRNVYLFGDGLWKGQRWQIFLLGSRLSKAFPWKRRKALLLDSRTLELIPGTCKYGGWARRNIPIMMFKIIHNFNQGDNCRHWHFVSHNVFGTFLI